MCHFAASLGVDAIAVGVEINSRLCVRALIKKASRPPINAQSARLKWHTPRELFHFKAGRKVTLLHLRCRSLQLLGSFIHRTLYSISRLCACCDLICSCGVFIKTTDRRRTSFHSLSFVRGNVALCDLWQWPKGAVLSYSSIHQWKGLHYEYMPQKPLFFASDMRRAAQKWFWSHHH